MQRVTNLEELSGAVIKEAKSIDRDQRLVLLLDNDRYAVLSIDRGWDAGDEEIEINGDDLSIADWCENELAPEDQVQEYRRKAAEEQERREQECMARTRREELEQLRRLQIKYKDVVL